MKNYIFLLAIITSVSFVVILSEQDSFAHRDGCHRWHSCPSDSGSYTCGDLGYSTYCPTNTAPAYEPPKETKKQETKVEPIVNPTIPSNPTSKPQERLPECKGTKLCISGTIKKIIDGDTLVIDDYTVRLSLTNTPEKDQGGFKQATIFTKKRCPVGATAIVDQDDKQPYDAYKRLVGKVMCSGNTLNSDLLYNNHANILTQYCKKSEFATESWAKRFGC